MEYVIATVLLVILFAIPICFLLWKDKKNGKKPKKNVSVSSSDSFNDINNMSF